jgi:hypothetical protein
MAEKLGDALGDGKGQPVGALMSFALAVLEA